MPDDETPTPTSSPENIVVHRAQPQVYSPSPEPGHSMPQRRVEDTKSYTGEWTVLLLALLTWASSFCVDMAQEESFQNMMTPNFVGTHIAQLFSVTVSVLAAKRLR